MVQAVAITAPTSGALVVCAESPLGVTQNGVVFAGLMNPVANVVPAPLAPVAPVGPAVPCGPVGPCGPCDPVGPWEPVAPVTPVAPCCAISAHGAPKLGVSLTLPPARQM